MGHEEAAKLAPRWAAEARGIAEFTRDYTDHLQGLLVKNALHAGGLTQRELAKVIGASKSKINRWANTATGYLVNPENEALSAALDRRFLGDRADEIIEAAAAYERTGKTVVFHDDGPRAPR
ncbi:helix-turn-helix domain-containing protein [Curtobacterium sp. UNCCL17]|uniref:helix-turn-helix domain-containing protein n=1 Tax=Curtobacterium sp. UNCCL17 TaxID=1449051 RepID=UPI0012DC8C66|nr:helix-turn-helix transcriptional regulator [Curtobacterium sp. UNCCL17]